MKNALQILGILAVSAIIGVVVGEKVFQSYFKQDLEEFKAKMLSQQK